MAELVKGFSKLSAHDKKAFVAKLTSSPESFLSDLESHFHPNEKYQSQYAEFAENTLSNYFLPFNIAPNFLINDKVYHVPMVIEESSVVAAASSAAGFWAKHGGFTSKIVDVEKIGQIHFRWFGSDSSRLMQFFESNKALLLQDVDHLSQGMKKRGGGVTRFELIDKTDSIDHLYELQLGFHTADAMGANYINTVLEALSKAFQNRITSEQSFSATEQECDIVMSILSNNTPNCVVEVSVEANCSVFENLSESHTGKEYAERFKLAVDIARIDPYRATTHNKGIYNGIDAVVLATGNDFRAIEAAGHTYAAKDGSYSSLSRCEINGDNFFYSMEVPIAVGSVGGITNIHPMAKWALDILQHPSASELMGIIACAGMANNFSAVRALTTKGIQHGHMRMHFANILNSLNANEAEKETLTRSLEGESISYSKVEQALIDLRNGKA
jgi:hydroxymethylglutaryl-CoA reductase